MNHSAEDQVHLTELETALAEATEALKAEQEARQAFVSLVTHELRVPMTSIKGYTDLLIKGIMGPVSDAQLSFLHTIRANVERMSKMVSDLSDINKIEGRRLSVSLTPVDVAMVVQEVTESVRATLEAKTLTLTTEPQAAVVLADRSRLAQVLGYLLDNAMQYTPDGGNITITAVVASEDPQRVRITVADTGYGIPEEEQDRIFEMFFRASDEETRATPGNGLSLNLSRRLLALQDGEIGFSSRRGSGSTFWVTLPAA